MVATDAKPKEESLLPTPSPRLHLGYLDGIRAVAAIYVAMFHAWCCIFSEEHPPTGRELVWTGWAMMGHYSVVVFIVLSGFCLMLPVVRGDGTLRGGVKSFFQRRARRILPPYYFAMIVSLLLIATLIGQQTGTAWDRSVPVTRFGLVTHLLLVHNVFKSTYYQINYPFWSVAVEWQIYFMFPALVWLWRRIGGLPATILAIVVAYLFVAKLHKTPYIGVTPQFYALFALGMLGAAIAFAPAPNWTPLREKIPWGLATLGVLFLFWAKHGMKEGRILDLVAGLAAACLLVSVSRPGFNPVRTLCASKPLVFVGTFSYSLYLLHAPLLQVIWRYGVQPLHLTPLTAFAVMQCLGIPLVLLSAYLFFLGCERPFLNTARTKASA